MIKCSWIEITHHTSEIDGEFVNRICWAIKSEWKTDESFTIDYGDSNYKKLQELLNIIIFDEDRASTKDDSLVINLIQLIERIQKHKTVTFHYYKSDFK